MSVDLPPLLLRPRYLGKPWGGRRLADELGRADLPAGPVGESWEVHGLGPDGGSVVEGGPYDGCSLGHVLGAPVPLLVKVIDAREDLSVQVHPDREDDGLKEEAWVALGDGATVAVEAAGAVHADPATPPAGGWLGCLARRALAAGCARTPRPPGMLHVPPGTVHAVLAGSLLLEVQNPVDVTWRLDDHGRTDAAGRARALHHAEAAPVLARPTPEPARPSGDGRRLVAARFELELLPPGAHRVAGPAALHFTRAGRIHHAGGVLEVPRGRTAWLQGAAERVASEGWVVRCAPR